MTRRPPRVRLACWLGLLLFAQCRLDDHPNHCQRNVDCTADEQCYRGFCVASEPNAQTQTQTMDEPVSSRESGTEQAPTPGADSGSLADSSTAASSGDAAASAAQDDDAAAPAPAAECQAAMACYLGPPATLGVGACMAGVRSCEGGQPGPCLGGQLPEPETCANEAQDNDCNGVRDDVAQRGKACEVDALEASCRAGTLRCVKGSADLQCSPTNVSQEICNGKDDDCDGAIDERMNLQTDPAHCGSCNHACTQGQSCKAGSCVAAAVGCGSTGPCSVGSMCCEADCVDVRYDSRHCGACGIACGNGETCCDGACVDTRSHLEHCGACGVSCQGSLPGCCDGSCKDLAHNDFNCGRCGASCGYLYGGLLCTCEQRGGRPRCEGRLLEALCL